MSVRRKRQLLSTHTKNIETKRQIPNYFPIIFQVMKMREDDVKKCKC